MATTITDNFQLNASLALDNKYGIFTGSVWRPYNDVTEANTTIVSSYRYIGLTVSVLLNGVPTEYWYIGGTADANLILKLKFNTTEFLPEWFGAVGDGVTDDSYAINAAIIAATNNTVVFTGGKTYSVSGITINNPVKISGHGILLKFTTETTFANKPVININTTDVNIEDITIDGSRAVITGIIAKTIPPPPSGSTYGINCSSVIGSPIIERIYINNIYVKNTYREGIRVDCCKDITITNSQIKNCQQHGTASSTNLGAVSLRANIGGLSTTEFGNITLSNCLIDSIDSVNGCIKTSGTTGNLNKRLRILNNTLLMGNVSNDSLGIECFTSLGTSSNYNNGSMRDIILSGNIIECVSANTGNQRFVYGISIGGNSSQYDQNANKGVESVLISNNIIRNCRKIGIEIIGKNINAIGNELYNSGHISINSNAVDGGMSGVKVLGNTLKNTGNINADGSHGNYGGVLVQAIGNKMDGLLIEGNIFDGVLDRILPASYTYDMIYIRSTPITTTTGTDTVEPPAITNLNIVNNQFLNILRNGIQFDGTTNAEDVKISGNMFEFSTLATTANLFYAITSSAYNLKNLSIVDNIFACIANTSSKGNGIRISNYKADLSSTYTNLSINNNNISNSYIAIYIPNSVDGLMITQNIIDVSATALNISAVATNAIINNNLIKNNVNPNFIVDGTTYLNPVFSTAAYTSNEALNTAYKFATVGQTVIYPAGNLMYYKIDSISWVSYPITNL
ncbi:hypothetical protein ACFGVS_06910 [Mucilaginibacter sp. AW1-7]|uniref:hypothetical protein n=1 Tax=Mucilaginibacter sp. AW1-7 TaxID=3349874 RepID=UPI003F73571C